jgi:hypothetical protein
MEEIYSVVRENMPKTCCQCLAIRSIRVHSLSDVQQELNASSESWDGKARKMLHRLAYGNPLQDKL